ncbi:hypothetical protein [Marinobacter salarius]|uniref:hypothetical protein n=1 Tax=Marinobacter salarius TaxID=1420917 RepID=UPI003BAAD90D
MKKTIAISLTCMLAVFSLVSFFLLPTKDVVTDVQPVESASEVIDQKSKQVSVPTREQTHQEALPDYHPDETGVKNVLSRKEVLKPPSLEETVASVETSLSDRIRALNQNLGDREARAALQRQLSGSDMEAYKAAVIWTVKNTSDKN